MFLALGWASQNRLAVAAEKPEKTKLNIGLPAPSASLFPNYVADEKGFYKEEGFAESKVLAFQGNAPTVQALASGTIDLCVASLHGLINTINSGQPFRGFWGGYNMTIFEWYAQPKFKSIAEAKGARFGVSRYGSLTDSTTRYIIRKAGLDPEKDVSILQIGTGATMLAALESGQLDVGILEIPYNFVASQKGFVKLMSQKDLAPDYPTHVAYAKESFITQGPNTIKAYLRATGKAMEWIKANREEAAKLMNKVLKSKLEECRPTIDYMADGWAPDGHLPREGMKVFWEIAVELGDAKEIWPENKWLDDRFIKTQDQWRK
jgi:NitT/TauT family transport system substrate-binding protein